MSQIRRQSIISSGVVYLGFAIGFFNTWLFAREGGFTQAQYGLTGIFIAVANIMYSFSNIGMTTYIYKFYPYYNDNLPKKQNDMLTWALLVSLLGFCLVVAGGLVFKDLVIRKFGSNSPDFVKYYYYIFPFGLGLTLFSILEAYAWQLHKSVLTNFLKEVQFRLFTTLLFFLTITGIISSFDWFIKLYSFTYLAIAFFLLIHLLVNGHFHLRFSISRVTRKFFRKILLMVSFVYSGGLVYTISGVFDSILIAAVLPDGLAMAGVYTLAQNIASLIQAPQRGIISSSVGPLAKAWKDKNMQRINRIYHSSSINMLLFSAGMFALIWMNFTEGVFTFHLQHGYLDARWIFFFIGLMRVVDMGTGVNAQIIGTSTRWRFDFVTGMLLLLITLPLNYVFTKYYFGVKGPAIANLISFALYNLVRFIFLYKKYGLQPFSAANLYVIIVSVAGYYGCYFLFNNLHGFGGIMIRSSVFIVYYVTLSVWLKLSPDLLPIWNTLLKKTGIKKGG